MPLMKLNIHLMRENISCLAVSWHGPTDKPGHENTSVADGGSGGSRGLYRLRKNPSNLFQKLCFVSGHGFSRAVSAATSTGPLGPEEGLSEVRGKSGSFSAASLAL
jgi:hypothetical protein